MNGGVYLTEAERKKIASLTSDVVRQRCREDPTFLGSIVASYVGEAQLAQEAVLERCKNDLEHRDAVVNHYLSGQSASRQVELLHQTLGVPGVVAQLGFNPFQAERKTAYDQSRRFVNSRPQRVVLLLGLVGFTVMALFPPWLKRDWQTQWLLFPVNHVINSEFAGYHFAFATMPGPASFDPSSNRDRTTYNWHVGLLVWQWFVWAVLIAILCVALRDRRTFEQRVKGLQTSVVGSRSSPTVDSPREGEVARMAEPGTTADRPRD
jgi:hypothetical protein